MLVAYDPAKVTYDSSSRRSGRTTTRPRACARATTAARSTAPRSTPPPTSSRVAEASQARYQERLTAAGYGDITTEIRPADEAPFFYAEGYHQQYLSKNPMGYCGIGGTGVSCPVGLVPPSAPA